MMHFYLYVGVVSELCKLFTVGINTFFLSVFMKLDHFPQNIEFLLVMEFLLKCFYKTEDIFPSIILVGKCVLNIFLKLPRA